MFRTRTAARFVAAVSAVAVVVPATGAYADGLVADGDGLAPIAASGLAFGAVCTSPTGVTKDVLLAVTRQAEGSNVFANGSTVTLSVPTQAAGVNVSFSTGGNTIALPTGWSGQANTTLSTNTATAQAKLSTSAAGSVSTTVEIVASGVNAENKAISRKANLAVTATVSNCAPADTTAPRLSLPEAVSAEATAPNGATVTYSATATDANPANPAVTCSPASGSTFKIGTTTVSCSAKDAANNTANGTFVVTVADTTRPVLTGTPSDMTLEATSAAGRTVSFDAPTATDAVGAGPVSCATAEGLKSGDAFGLGTHTVTCSSSDAAGNKGTSSFAIKVQDTTAPAIGVITAPAATEATSGAGAEVTYTAPTATDAVTSNITVSCAPASGSVFKLGATEVTCSAVDAAGNTASEKFNVVVKDETAPVLIVPVQDVVEEATGPTGAAVTYTATASDIVDGNIDPTCTPGSGSTFALGTGPVNCEATDKAGNKAERSFNVTVRDTTKPVLTNMDDLLLEATSAAGKTVSFDAPTATDAVGAGPVSCATAADAGGLKSGDAFKLGTHTVTCSSTDAAGNTGTETFEIKVQDTTKPTLTTPANISTEATSPQGAAVTYSATATDTVDSSVAVSCTPASGGAFALGETTVKCTATDDSGNVDSGEFKVTVVDTTKPTLNVPADQLAVATGLTGAVVNYPAPTASDIVDTQVDVSCSPSAGSTFAIGTTTVNCAATDDAGNRQTGSFTVNVQRSFNGFFQPVDTGRTLNMVKAGSTLPLKFEVFAGSTEMTGTDIFKPLSVKTVACSATAPVDEIEVLTSGGTAVKYDAANGGQYIWNWKTPSTPGACYQVTVATVDGAAKTALFKLR